MKRIIWDVLIYILIVGGIVYGFPKLLSWWLGTPHPLAAVTSNSMWPVYTEGDLVVIEGVKKEELKVGDIIVFTQLDGPGFTIHRIVKLEKDNLTTKGDANFEPDAPIKYEQVAGRGVTIRGKAIHLPYLGSLTMLTNRLK